MRILVGAFSRSSLGHVIRSARVAAHMATRGHDIVFCCAEEAQHYPRALGLQVALVPELTPLGPWKTWRTEDELRQATKGRMASPKFLADCLAVERPIVETFRPDVIVADLRNTLCVLGAMNDIPVINLTNMKLLTFPMPIVYPCVIESLLEIGVPEDAAKKVLGDVIAIPGFSSHEPLSDIAPGIWSLAHEGVREIRHVGPILPSYAGDIEPPSQGSIYFSLGGAMSVGTDLPLLLEKVRGRPERFVIHRGEHLSEESMLSALDGRSDVSSFDYRPDCASLMAGASVSVIHGGHGTIYDVIGAGRPALVTPNNAEQKGNGRLLESLGMALVLEPSSSAEDLNAALDRLRFDPAFAQAARRAQQRIKDSDGLKNLALMIESGVM